jgi:hypothetical protein
MAIEDFDREQLAIGLQHELEHTRDRNVALIIDHLAEDPEYYRKLEEVGL